MLTSKQIQGHLSELKTQARLTELRIPFAIPFSFHSEYDLVIETKSGFKSVQIKTCYFDNSKNQYIVSLVTSHRRGGQNIKNKKYKSNAFDFLIAFCQDYNIFYIIPIGDILGRRSITFYPNNTPPINRRKSYRNYENYKDRFDLLK